MPARGRRAIDHVAVPMEWEVGAVHSVAAGAHGRRLSYHDAYVLAVDH